MKLIKSKLTPLPHHTLTVGALLCLSVFPSAAVHAQTATNDLKEIIVQSGRLEQKQFDAPASVYTVDADTLRSSGAQVNLSDVLNRAPGVVAMNRNNYAQDVQISIRGFGSRAAFGLRGIRLIADGIPASMPDGQGQASTVSMTSADRMEVLTGPLALMYGNASGGVIQTFTREAGDTPEAQVNLYTGSFGMKRTDWQVSQRTGNVGLVADYSTFSTQGYREHSAAERKQLNSVITLDAKPDTRFKFIINLFDMPNAQDPLGLPMTAAANAPSLSTPSRVVSGATDNNTRKTVKQDQVGAVMEHTVNSDLRFSGRVYGGTRSNLQYQATVPAGWTGLERRYEGLGLQANGKAEVFGGQRMTWSTGVDYDHAQEQRQAGLTTQGEKTANPTRDELNQATNLDYFAQANWALSERYTLTTGVRQSDVTLKSRDDYKPFTATDPDGSGRVHYKATSPVLGLTWHAQDNLNLYANHGRGFETPTLSETAYQVGANNTINPSFNKSLLASRSKHLEIGTKWRPSPEMRIDAAWFRITTENEIVSTLSKGGKTAYTNAPSTLRDGLEIAMRTQHTSHWRSHVSATVMHATYEDAFTSTSVKGGPPIKATTPAGNSLPAIPKQQLFASLQWSEKGFALAGQKPALGLEAGLDWVRRSSMWASDSNSAADGLAPGYDLFNARVRQRYQVGIAGVEAFVGIDNLTNKSTVSSVIVNQSAGQYFEPGLPRSWILGVQTKIPL